MYAMNFAQVGANVQRQLDLKGMTQQSLADALSVSRHVINKIIKGSKSVNVNELARIASALGTTADALLTVPDKLPEADCLSFMGNITDQATLEKVDLIRSAIDEIHILEELLNA